MPIHQALQLSYTSAKLGGSYFNRSLGSTQIVGGHLVSILRREQAALRGDQLTQFLCDLPADLSPLAFTGARREHRALAFVG